MALVERGPELARLRDCVAGAAGGSGAGVAVVGEPGAGKSALVQAACAGVSGVRVLRGACDPLLTPRPLGPFRDLARQVDLQPLRQGAEPSLPEVCELVHDALGGRPTALVVEDLHWADRASVEVLRFLVRRIATVPLALLVTYRADEIGPRHPARPLLGDFAVLDRLDTLDLAPLSVAGVAELLRGTPLDPHRVRALTGGNPFFAAEVAKDPGRPLPATVRDAVLARTADMDARDLEVLQLVAAAPDRLDERVLAGLGVDLATLSRLDGTGLLVRSDRGLTFRHELARLALESTVPPCGAAQLHRRLLDALERLDPGDHAVLAHHAVAAGEAARELRHADLAAAGADRAGAHTEAVAFLRTALHHLPPGRARQRAALLLRLGVELYLTNDLGPAITTVSASFPLWAEAGDGAGLAAAHATAAVLHYYDAQRRPAEEHAERAAAIAGPGRAPAYASACATRGFLAFHRSEYDVAAACLQEAARAGVDGDEELRLRTTMIADFADVALERPGARDRLVRHIDLALAHDLDEIASTGFSNLTNLDVEHRRLDDAEALLQRSIAHAAGRDIAICSHYQTGVRARLHLLRGRWRACEEDAAQVLRDTGMPMAQLWPHLAAGLVRLRRDGGDGGHLEAAWRLAEGLDEPLRRVAVLCGLAERSWLTGEPDERVAAAAPELHRLASTPAGAWSAGELAVWLRRLGLLQEPPAHVAAPWALALDGRHVEAAAWWHRCGAAHEEALELADSGEPQQGVRALERLDRLGAAAVADRLRLHLRRRGLVAVPQRRRSTTLANPCGLTDRQLDVARLVARGLTNAEIAQRLYISPKTADHHVSAVLTKLGVPNRRQVAVAAHDIGL
ncbi:ATP-binding protein [Kineococcus glutinatus]|uniref:AAA family ATPase n=1 Tax=Kineococcus glutinatus TaxID=1070872 RepID=A0ABP9I5U4_9ACTN